MISGSFLCVRFLVLLFSWPLFTCSGLTSTRDPLKTTAPFVEMMSLMSLSYVRFPRNRFHFFLVSFWTRTPKGRIAIAKAAISARDWARWSLMDRFQLLFGWLLFCLLLPFFFLFIKLLGEAEAAAYLLNLPRQPHLLPPTSFLPFLRVTNGREEKPLGADQGSISFLYVAVTLNNRPAPCMWNQVYTWDL